MVNASTATSRNCCSMAPGPLVCSDHNNSEYTARPLVSHKWLRVTGDTRVCHHCREIWLARSFELTSLPMLRGFRKIRPGAEYPFGAPFSVSIRVRFAYAVTPNRPVK